MKTTAFYCLLTISLFLAGCSNTGLFPSSNVTDVRLADSNYKLVATNVNGEAEVAYILGLSISYGMATQTLAIFRVSGTGLVYKEALEELWANFESAHGPVAGRSLALANVRYDSDVLNLLLYTKVRISIRADIVEFSD